jgi:hypothetical protein
VQRVLVKPLHGCVVSKLSVKFEIPKNEFRRAPLSVHHSGRWTLGRSSSSPTSLGACSTRAQVVPLR